MQTMPTIVYLAPLTLLFLIGPASATLATLVYATPPVVRLTAHGVRGVSRRGGRGGDVARLEPAGRRCARWSLPLARRSIVLGVNQTTMAALSMVTIAALIDAPGLGKTVIKALQTLDVGVAFNAGLGIVVLAVVLDRVTTAAQRPGRGGPPPQHRAPAGAASSAWSPAAALAVVAVQLSRTYLWAATFPVDRRSATRSPRAVDAATGGRADAAVRADRRRSRTASPAGCSTRSRRC